jgi:adenylate cyclase class IV
MINISGPDRYYENGKDVLRWRQSEDLAELTIKRRASKKETFVREEIDLKIEKQPHEDVENFIGLLGFKHSFTIKKDCHIFWFSDTNGDVCVCAYKVHSDNKPPLYVIEIEAPKGLAVFLSKKMVSKWEKVVGISSKKRVNKSLYEIYSGKKNKLAEKSTIDKAKS